jgi:hypothetical protein
VTEAWRHKKNQERKSMNQERAILVARTRSKNKSSVAERKPWRVLLLLAQALSGKMSWLRNGNREITAARRTTEADETAPRAGEIENRDSSWKNQPAHLGANQKRTEEKTTSGTKNRQRADQHRAARNRGPNSRAKNETLEKLTG